MYTLTSTVPLLHFLSLSLSLSLILSGILGFIKLKIVFYLSNGLHIGRIVSKITSTSLGVLQKMSNSMQYDIVINSHIAFNYIHIKLSCQWCYGTRYEDQFVGITFDMLLQPIKNFTANWTKLFVMPSNCKCFFFFL